MILPPKKDDSCVLWLDFASVKNNTVYDQSKYHNDGTIYGAQHIGRFGLHGLSFDGVDDYVDLGLDSRYVQNGQKELTLMWFGDIKQTYDRQSVLIGTYDNLIKLYSRDYINQGISFFLKHDDTNVWLAVPGKMGKTFIVATYSSNEGKKKIYVDGMLSGEVNDTGELQNFEAEFYIGSANIYHGGYFWGDTYFAAIYNRALSDAEIRELYYYLTKGIRSIVPSRFVARKVR